MIIVYGDIACPFASLALHGLRTARSRLGREDVAFDIRPYPLELINKRPHRPSLIEAEKEALLAVEPTLGWHQWRYEDGRGWPVSTLLPLAAVVAAKRPSVGGLPASDALDQALRRAFYVEGRCVTLLPVIIAAARTCPQVNVDALAEELRSGVGLADVIDGSAVPRTAHASPHIFAPNGLDWVNPGIELDHDADGPTVRHYDQSVYATILKAAA